MRRSSYRRAAALAAVVAAAFVVAYLTFGPGGPGYEVHAIFQNAGQLVRGDYVQVAGLPAGKVTDLKLTPDGQAELTLHIDAPYAPLRAGTQATVRATGLTGIANRYVSLRLAPATNAKIPDGGTITTADTTSAVDLDQLFNTFDSRTRRALQRFVQGSAGLYAGRTAQARLGWLYLDPFLSTSSQLLGELDRDTPALARFVVANSHLATDVGRARPTSPTWSTGSRPQPARSPCAGASSPTRSPRCRRSCGGRTAPSWTCARHSTTSTRWWRARSRWRASCAPTSRRLGPSSRTPSRRCVELSGIVRRTEPATST